MGMPFEARAPTRLDCAKGIVEQIVTRRAHFNDRFMLFTYNEVMPMVAGLKNSTDSLLTAVKRLKATDRFYGGRALASIFDQLQLMRTAYDLDTYGYGRYPMLGEPTSIIWITDGGAMVGESGLLDKLNIPVNNTPWSDLGIEPFRWDQRMFTIFLHGENDPDLCKAGLQSSERHLAPMCTVMGGSVHHVPTMKAAQRLVDLFCPPRVAPPRNAGLLSWSGVLVKFERMDGDPRDAGNVDHCVLVMSGSANVTRQSLPPASSQATQDLRKSFGFSAVDGGVAGFFPIPESFWPTDLSPESRPPRTAHPVILYSQKHIKCDFPPKFPFDKFQIDTNSNVARKLLEASSEHIVNWPVYVHKSYKEASGFPFGILRANSARTAVNLFILPYNFPALFILLHKLLAAGGPSAGLTPQWQQDFEQYLSHTPPYYAYPLRRVFSLAGLPVTTIPRNYGSNPALNALLQGCHRMRVASIGEWDKLQASPTPAAKALITDGKPIITDTPEFLVTNAFDVPRSQCLDSLNALRQAFIKECMAIRCFEFYPNPFAGLPQSLSRLPPSADGLAADTAAFTGNAVVDDLDSMHAVPISVMGKFQYAMNKQQSLAPRDPNLSEEEKRRLRRTMFGNPYERSERTGQDRKGMDAGVLLPTKPGSQLGRVDEEVDEESEIEIEAELNEAAIEDIKIGSGGDEKILGTDRGDQKSESKEASIKQQQDYTKPKGPLDAAGYLAEKFGYKPRKSIPRRRSIKAQWKPGDTSWNVNPWNTANPSALTKYTRHSPANSVRPKTPTARGALSAGSGAAAPQVPVSQKSASTTAQTYQRQSIPAPVPRRPSLHPQTVEHHHLIPSRTPTPPMPHSPLATAPPAIPPRSLTPPQQQQQSLYQPPSSQSSSTGNVQPSAQLPPQNIPSSGIAVPKARPQTSSPPVTTGMTPSRLKSWLLTNLRSGNVQYDERAIMTHLRMLEPEDPRISIDHKRLILKNVLATAKQNKRKEVIIYLDRLNRLYSKGPSK